MIHVVGQIVSHNCTTVHFSYCGEVTLLIPLIENVVQCCILVQAVLPLTAEIDCHRKRACIYVEAPVFW